MGTQKKGPSSSRRTTAQHLYCSVQGGLTSISLLLAEDLPLGERRAYSSNIGIQEVRLARRERPLQCRSDLVRAIHRLALAAESPHDQVIPRLLEFAGDGGAARDFTLQFALQTPSSVITHDDHHRQFVANQRLQFG